MLLSVAVCQFITIYYNKLILSRGLNIVVSGAETVLSLVIRPLCAVKTFTNDTEGRKLLSMKAGQELW